MTYRGRAIKQFGFSVACDALGLDTEHLAWSDDHVLTIPRRDGAAACAATRKGELLCWGGAARPAAFPL